MILSLVSSAAIFGVGLNNVLSGTFASTSLFVQYIFLVCGFIGALASGVQLFKLRNQSE
ncbi:hypothetical protein [Bacillus massiliigorillae]|uniref:hypothetical protein n=1 Tax=Bacillus massiliigorillae TaxID=1243664 RepID=UPI00039A326A|nr:hypothetical protein [Bacillus massiliigorillae]